MHSYLTWLHGELSELETHQAGRRQVSAAGVSVPGLRSLIAKMEGTFKSIAPSQSSPVGAGGAVGGAGGAGGVPGPLPPVRPDDRDDSDATTTAAAGGGDGGPRPPPPRELPFLERALGAELRRRVSGSLDPSPPAAAAAGGGGGGEGGEGGKASSTKRSPPSSTPTRPTAGVKPSRRHVGFDELYRKLVEFKDETGHACPTLKHPELGWWVSELRARRKALREMGLEWEPTPKAEGGAEDPNDDDDREDSTSAVADAVAVAGGGSAAKDATTTDAPHPEKGGDAKSKPTAMGNTHLSEGRVRLLDDVSFVWWALPERVAWEQRLEELRAFREAHGRFPTNKVS